MATGQRIQCDDAALAKSLQLAADMEYIESELALSQLLKRHMVVVRGRNVVPCHGGSPQRTMGAVARQPPRPIINTPSISRQPARSTAVIARQPVGSSVATVRRSNRSNNDSAKRDSRNKPRAQLEPSGRVSSNRALQQQKDLRSKPSKSLAAIFSDGSDDNTNKSLLYVPCEVNASVVEMMVDTGAQTSVISAPLMRKLRLEKMLNTRLQGVAAGVGTAQILGRIENCPVQIGHVEFLLYFSVLDIPDDLMILGIDQMRRFNCLLDLEHDKLVFGGKGGVEVDFFTQSA